jgi:hypothetical protein
MGGVIVVTWFHKIRTRDFPAWSIAAEPTTPPSGPHYKEHNSKIQIALEISRSRDLGETNSEKILTYKEKKKEKKKKIKHGVTKVKTGATCMA